MITLHHIVVMTHLNIKMETIHLEARAFKILHLKVVMEEEFKIHLQEAELEIEEGHHQCKVNQSNKVTIEICNQIKY